MKDRIYSVSFPRSGHHFLARLLRAYFGKKLTYCPYYSSKPTLDGTCHASIFGHGGGCRAVPCINSTTTFSKNHDRNFDMPQDLGNYVVQYRNPIPAAVSNFELHLAHTGFRFDTAEHFYNSFMPAEVRYWRRWLSRWVLGFSGPTVITLSYETLTADTEGALAAIIRLAGDDVDELMVAKVIETVGVNPPKDVRDFRHWDEEKMLTIEERLRPDIVSAGLPLVCTRRGNI